MKTSKPNVLLSGCAWSTRGVLFFFGSLLAAASGATLASSAPAWGSGNGRSFAPGALARRRGLPTDEAVERLDLVLVLLGPPRDLPPGSSSHWACSACPGSVDRWVMRPAAPVRQPARTQLG
ncbi:hypothetical protein D187_004329 [Cystobacter fuscus DSM 2262]|uniref:Uncharacterized protein n=1 Tax=Cystobacter fuscus (strain ATCC 25194 / DSM 2262 / NBRC 100088 / M29) TaxID=1242864 RepID=S9P0R9_CYSF2|nr:hypothetical protein D187_004329 [Cystobacter fuscus DSM 2262]